MIVSSLAQDERFPRKYKEIPVSPKQKRSSRFSQSDGIRDLVALGRSIELPGNFQSLLHEKQPVCISFEGCNNVVVKLRLGNSFWSEGAHEVEARLDLFGDWLKTVSAVVILEPM